MHVKAASGHRGQSTDKSCDEMNKDAHWILRSDGTHITSVEILVLEEIWVQCEESHEVHVLSSHSHHFCTELRFNQKPFSKVSLNVPGWPDQPSLHLLVDTINFLLC